MLTGSKMGKVKLFTHKNMKYSDEQRTQLLSKLPEEVKSAIASEKNLEYLRNIGTKYNLSVDERPKLGEAVGLVLLGILSMKEFQERMQERIDGPPKQVNKLVREVQEQIFQPIAGSLKKLTPEEILRKAKQKPREEAEEGGHQPVLDIPVPPPPGGDTPSPSYGGTSDPYREPVDD